MLLAIRNIIATAVQGGAEWGTGGFCENLHASLFDKGLSNEPNLGQIHLAGQYL